MSADVPGAVDVPAIDIRFGLTGDRLPTDYAWPLFEALAARLPWLATEPGAGVHPLRTLPAGEGEVLLAQRTKLVLRVPQSRSDDALSLARTQLTVGGHALSVGMGAPRALVPSATIAAQRVASPAPDVTAFEGEVADALAARGVAARVIAGRARRSQSGSRLTVGYAVTLHGLRAEDSLRVQREGVGGERALGWGVFVPAKTITIATD